MNKRPPDLATIEATMTGDALLRLLATAERRGARLALRKAAWEAGDSGEFTYPEDAGHVEAWLDGLADELEDPR